MLDFKRVTLKSLFKFCLINMKTTSFFLISAVTLASTTLSVRAESLATKSASSAAGSASQSVGSASQSLKSADSSVSSGKKTAKGEYTLTEVMASVERPGTMQLTLQTKGVDMVYADRQDTVVLLVPAGTASQLTTGQTVTANERPYGLEFAHGADQKAFFLVLNDAWHQELATRALAL
jgi:hypothetical protein